MQLLSIKCSANIIGVIRLYDEDGIEDLVDRSVNALTRVNDRAGIFNCREDAKKAVQ